MEQLPKNLPISQLCEICRCPLAEGCIPLAQIDEDKFCLWMSKYKNVDVDRSKIASASICIFCVREARSIHEIREDSNVPVWWPVLQDPHFHYYKKGWMKPCSIQLEKMTDEEIEDHIKGRRGIEDSYLNPADFLESIKLEYDCDEEMTGAEANQVFVKVEQSTEFDHEFFEDAGIKQEIGDCCDDFLEVQYNLHEANAFVNTADDISLSERLVNGLMSNAPVRRTCINFVRPEAAEMPLPVHNSWTEQMEKDSNPNMSGEMIIHCIECSEKFTSPMSLSSHMMLHHPLSDQALYQQKKDEGLKLVRSVQPLNILKCPNCVQKYFSMYTFYEHCITHHPKRIVTKNKDIYGVGGVTYSCTICKSFQTKINSKSLLHAKCHVDYLKAKAVVCMKCQIQFPSVEDRNQHGCQQYRFAKCNMCSVDLRWMFLESHKSSVKCSICSRLFPCQTFLDYHMLDRKHYCKTCQRVFCWNWEYQEHLASDHLMFYNKLIAAKPACNTCKLEFDNFMLCLDHLNKIHPAKHSCGICNKMFLRPEDLEGHGQMHNSLKHYKISCCHKCLILLKPGSKEAGKHGDC